MAVLWLHRGTRTNKDQVHMEMRGGERDRERKQRGERRERQRRERTGEAHIWGLELPWVDRVPR